MYVGDVMDKTSRQLYEEREKRILDAIALKEPDRIPVVPLFAFFNCYYTCITPGEAYRDPEKGTPYRQLNTTRGRE